MNPLSPFTYYRRHKGQALLLLVLIGSLTLGIFVLVGAMLTSLENFFYPCHFLTRMSRILAGQALDADSVAQIRAHPDVATVLPENGLFVNYPIWPFLGSSPVLGVTEEIVHALDLQIGDVIDQDVDEDFYQAVRTKLTLVGILESIPSQAGPVVQLGLVSYEYLDGHEAYQPRLSNLLIIPRQGRRAAVNDFAETLVNESNSIASVRLQTFERETEEARKFKKLYTGTDIFAGGVVAVSAALVVGTVNRIAIAQRLSELGLLQAAGYAKRRLFRRLVIEMVAIAGVGWGSGLLLAVMLSILLNAILLETRQLQFLIDLANPVPLLFTLPIPIAVVSWVAVSVRRVLRQLDAVAIIERGKLSMERVEIDKQGMGCSRVARSSSNPLSSWTFYLRHRQRSMALLASTGLMVLGVVFAPFVVTMLIDSAWPLFLSYSSHTSIVSPAPTYQTVDPAILAQIRAHPAVAHVIPVKALSMMVNVVAPISTLPVYGMRQEDMQTLLDVYDLHVGEGELVQPRSGQIVLTRALARNRGLSVGDTVGKPIHERDSMPTELTIVGLLDPAAPGLAEREGYYVPTVPRWVGFISYEFVESHQRYSDAPMHTLVIATEGREAEVETWLEESIASSQVEVRTFGTGYRFWHEIEQTGRLTLALGEAILAVAATIALAILNYIFFTQRQDEFGVLHTAGHSRARLVARTLRESIGIAGAAWLIGAACCAVLVLGAQTFVYVPRGMSLDLTDIVPWLFTLPIPVAVVAASAGTITWALSRLDPVAVIERR